jgi:hypothetical protein
MLGGGEAVNLDNIKIDKIITDPMKGGCEFAALWADINGLAVL